MKNERVLPWLKNLFSALDKASAFTRWLYIVGVAILFGLACFVFVEVILRYVFRHPVGGSSEIIALFLVPVVFFGIAYTQVYKGHINVDLITSRLSPKVLIITNTIITFLVMLLFSIMTWRSYVTLLQFIDISERSIVLNIRAAPFAATVTVGCAFLTVVLIRDLLKNIIVGLKLCFSARIWALTWSILILVIVLAVLWAQPTLWEVSLPIVGIIGLLAMLLLMLAGMPIAFVLIMIGFLFIAHIAGLEVGLNTIGRELFRSTSQYNWSVFALFILMGFLISSTGIGKDLYYTMYRWFGHLHGGLAIATISALTGVAAVVGEDLSAIATMGPVSMPEMRRYRYDDSLAAGCISAGATLGPLIPPSVAFIMYGLLTKESIGQLFLAGIVPGILLSAAFILTIYIRCRRNPSLGPAGKRSTWRDRLISLRWGGPILFLFLIIIGGIYMGIFTPTEGGGIGAIGAFLIAVGMRRLTRQNFINTLMETGKLVVMIFLIIAGSMIFSYFMALTRMAVMLAEFVAALPVPPFIIVACMILVFLILGCLMDPIPIMLITVPMFYPIVVDLGYDPIWFGVIVVITANLGLITPPVGVACFALKGLFPDLPISVIFRGVIPFIISTLIVITLVFVFPSIATWVPYLIKM